MSRYSKVVYVLKIITGENQVDRSLVSEENLEGETSR